MSLSPFDVVKNINGKTNYLSDEDLKGYSQWMVNKILACDSQYVMLAAQLTKYKMTDREHYDICWFGLPKSNKFIQYLLKKPKAETDIKYPMQYFECSQDVAKQYLPLIHPDEMKSIVDMYEKHGVTAKKKKGEQ